MIDSLQLANYVITLCNEAKVSVSNLKLQKLLYYIQGRSLAIFGEGMIRDDFQARMNGPVCRKVYNKYCTRGFSDLTLSVDISMPSLTANKDGLICEVIEKYGPIDARDLVALTHSETPRIEARKGIKNTEPSNNIITKTSIKNYFKKIMDEQSKSTTKKQ